MEEDWIIDCGEYVYYCGKCDKKHRKFNNKPWTFVVQTSCGPEPEYEYAETCIDCGELLKYHPED